MFKFQYLVFFIFFVQLTRLQLYVFLLFFQPIQIVFLHSFFLCDVNPREGLQRHPFVEL